jgi:hypothetical protein
MKKILVGLLMIPMMAHASFMDGNKLLSRFESKTDLENTYAWGYVVGVYDSYSNIICTGGGATVKQVSDVVHKYLKDNPAQRNMDAAVLVLVALGTAFPCPDNKNKGGKRS